MEALTDTIVRNYDTISFVSKLSILMTPEWHVEYTRDKELECFVESLNLISQSYSCAINKYIISLTHQLDDNGKDLLKTFEKWETFGQKYFADSGIVMKILLIRMYCQESIFSALGVDVFESQN